MSDVRVAVILRLESLHTASVSLTVVSRRSQGFTALCVTKPSAAQLHTIPSCYTGLHVYILGHNRSKKQHSYKNILTDSVSK